MHGLVDIGVQVDRWTTIPRTQRSIIGVVVNFLEGPISRAIDCLHLRTMPSTTSWLPFLALWSLYTTLASAASGQQPLKALQEARGYNAGEPIPVTCLNRTM